MSSGSFLRLISKKTDLGDRRQLSERRVTMSVVRCSTRGDAFNDWLLAGRSEEFEADERQLNGFT